MFQLACVVFQLMWLETIKVCIGVSCFSWCGWRQSPTPLLKCVLVYVMFQLVCVMFQPMCVMFQLVWLETVSNPTTKVLDLKTLVTLTRQRSPAALIVVDNTFLTPYLHVSLHWTTTTMIGMVVVVVLSAESYSSVDNTFPIACLHVSLHW